MSSIDEKRMYDDRRAETVAYVASGQGVATVRVSGDRVGRFSLAERCRARDVAAVAGQVYVATDEDVLVGPDPFESLDFGPAVAVGVGDEGLADDALLAADEDGTVSRYRDGEWATLGSVDEVRAIEGDLVAAADGVYRLDGGDLVHAGLADVRDVAAGGVVLAATDDGLYRLGNGWLRERAGEFTTVAAGFDHAHAAAAEELFERAGDDEEWHPVDLPVDEPVAGVDYGECVYAVTTAGTFLVEADPETTPDGTGGWRSRALGLSDVAGVAVASARRD